MASIIINYLNLTQKNHKEIKIFASQNKIQKWKTKSHKQVKEIRYLFEGFIGRKMKISVTVNSFEKMRKFWAKNQEVRKSTYLIKCLTLSNQDQAHNADHIIKKWW